MKIDRLNFFFSFYILILVAVDILALFFSLEVATLVRSSLNIKYLDSYESISLSKYFWMIFIVITLFMYEKIYFFKFDFWGDIKRIIKGLAYSFVIIITVITLSQMYLNYSISFISIFFILSLFSVILFKSLCKWFLFKYDIFKTKVKVVAEGEQLNTIVNEMKNNWYYGFKLNDEKYDMVLISSKNYKIDVLQKMIKKYSKKTKDVYVIPYMDHLDFSHVSIVEYSNIRLSAVHIENRLLNYKNILLKYIFEILLILSVLPIVLVLHILITLAIKIDSKGSARFKQKRCGQNGEQFSCYKYRTMYSDNREILTKYLEQNPDEIEYFKIYQKYKNDPRITKVGKFLRETSLDELPQFFNVLRRDMNLIGPRPVTQEEIDNHYGENAEYYFMVKPGITGLWQVNGRNKLTFEQRVELDRWYIQNWSLWIDFVVFFKTFKVVLSKVGAK